MLRTFLGTPIRIITKCSIYITESLTSNQPTSKPDLGIQPHGTSQHVADCRQPYNGQVSTEQPNPYNPYYHPQPYYTVPVAPVVTTAEYQAQHAPPPYTAYPPAHYQPPAIQGRKYSLLHVVNISPSSTLTFCSLFLFYHVGQEILTQVSSTYVYVEFNLYF